MNKEVDFLFEKAKQEFLQSGKTISESLKEKGYGMTYGDNWMPPDGDNLRCSMSEEDAFNHVLKNWFN